MAANRRPKRPAKRKNAASQRVTTTVTRPNGTSKTTTTEPVAKVDAVDTGFDRDTYDSQVLKKISARVAAVLGQNPEIQRVFQKAWDGGYAGDGGKSRFWADIERTEFWQKNSKDLREYVIASADPTNPDFQIKQKQAREQVRQNAMAMGVTLDQAQIDAIGEEYLMGGWGKPENNFMLQQRLGDLLSGATASGGGAFDSTKRSLQDLALKNGVAFSDGWYDSAARSVASNLSDEAFWQSKIREQAASMFPVFRDQIDAGQDVINIANPYLQLMYQYWGTNPYEVQLSDPTLMKGLTGFDDKGNPRAMNLGDFTQMLRDDPRYLNTDRGKGEMASTASKVLEMFGIVGGAR